MVNEYNHKFNYDRIKNKIIHYVYNKDNILNLPHMSDDEYCINIRTEILKLIGAYYSDINNISEYINYGAYLHNNLNNSINNIIYNLLDHDNNDFINNIFNLTNEIELYNNRIPLINIVLLWLEKTTKHDIKDLLD